MVRRYPLQLRLPWPDVMPRLILIAAILRRDLSSPCESSIPAGTSQPISRTNSSGVRCHRGNHESLTAEVVVYMKALNGDLQRLTQAA